MLPSEFLRTSGIIEKTTPHPGEESSATRTKPPIHIVRPLVQYLQDQGITDPNIIAALKQATGINNLAEDLLLAASADTTTLSRDNHQPKPERRKAVHPAKHPNSEHVFATLVRETPQASELFVDNHIGHVDVAWNLLPQSEFGGKKDPYIVFKRENPDNEETTPYMLYTTWRPGPKGKRWQFKIGLAKATSSNLLEKWEDLGPVTVDMNRYQGSGFGAPTARIERTEQGDVIHIAYQTEFIRPNGKIIEVSQKDPKNPLKFGKPRLLVEAMQKGPRSISYDVSHAIIRGNFMGIQFPDEGTNAYAFAGRSITRLDNDLCDTNMNFYLAYQDVDGQMKVIEKPFLKSNDNPFVWQDGDPKKLREYHKMEAPEINTVRLNNGDLVDILTYVVFTPRMDYRQALAMTVYDKKTDRFIHLGLFLSPHTVTKALSLKEPIKEVGHGGGWAKNPDTGMLEPNKDGKIYYSFMARDGADHDTWNIGVAAVDYDKYCDFILHAVGR